jgi:hypothetical protein
VNTVDSLLIRFGGEFYRMATDFRKRDGRLRVGHVTRPVIENVQWMHEARAVCGQRGLRQKTRGDPPGLSSEPVMRLLRLLGKNGVA